MAALLTNQTTATTGTGVQMTGPSSVTAFGTFDGASVVIQAARNDTEAEYQSLGFKGNIQGGGWGDVNILGTYYIRAKLERPGASTSVSVDE